MLIKRMAGVAVALACITLLSSCSILQGLPIPGASDSDGYESTPKADARMKQIADAVKHHDAAALTKLFSPGARAKDADMDSGLKYFLSLFPSGQMTWKIENGGPGGTGLAQSGKKVLESFAYYDVTANGKSYELVYGDVYTDTFQPDEVGLYALGVARNNSDDSAEWTASGDPTPFYNWIDTLGVNNLGDTIGDAGVYVPHKTPAPRH